MLHTGVFFFLHSGLAHKLEILEEQVSYRHWHLHLRRSLKSQAPRRLHSEHWNHPAVDHVARGSLPQHVRCEKPCRLHVDSISKGVERVELLLLRWCIGGSNDGRGGSCLPSLVKALWYPASSPSTSSLPYTSPRNTRTHSKNPRQLNNTVKMSDDEERVTMPFKFVTGTCTSRPSHELEQALTMPQLVRPDCCPTRHE